MRLPRPIQYAGFAIILGILTWAMGWLAVVVSTAAFLTLAKLGANP